MFIYVIRHNVSGREYVGQTVQRLSARMACHKWDAYNRSNSVINRAIRKYGVDAFTMELLAVANSMIELDELEQRFIRERDTLRPHGFNILEGGQGELRTKGKPAPKTAETRAKIAATLSGRKLSPALRAKWREVALQKSRQKIAATKAAWTPEQREANRRNHAEARRQWWASRTPEQLEAIRRQRAETTKQQWAALADDARATRIQNAKRGQAAA